MICPCTHGWWTSASRCPFIPCSCLISVGQWPPLDTAPMGPWEASPTVAPITPAPTPASQSGTAATCGQQHGTCTLGGLAGVTFLVLYYRTAPPPLQTPATCLPSTTCLCEHSGPRFYYHAHARASATGYMDAYLPSRQNYQRVARRYGRFCGRDRRAGAWAMVAAVAHGDICLVRLGVDHWAAYRGCTPIALRANSRHRRRSTSTLLKISSCVLHALACAPYLPRLMPPGAIFASGCRPFSWSFCYFAP